MALKDRVSSLAPFAIALITVFIVIAAGTLVLSNFNNAAYDENTVTDEQDTLTTPLPDTYTLENVEEGVKERSETVVFNDVSADTNTTLEKDTDYTVDYAEGEITVENTSTTEDFNESEDFIYTDYTYYTSNTASDTVDKALSAMDTFTEFGSVIVIVGVAAVIFMLLGAFGIGAGSRTGM